MGSARSAGDRRRLLARRDPAGPEIAADIRINDARFVESNLYELPDHLDGEFEVVYTSRGVLGWLPDIRAWARVVGALPRSGRDVLHHRGPSGRQHVRERGCRPGELRLTYPYWEHHDPLVFDVTGSYADPSADVGEQKEHGWDHGLGEIVTALIDAGLRIESLEEHPFLDWAADFLVETAPGSGRFVLPPGRASCR